MEVPKNEPPTAQENPKMRSNLMFSLYFSLLAGNSVPESGSHKTPTTAIKSL